MKPTVLYASGEIQIAYTVTGSGAVHMSARIAGLANAREVLVSSTVRDLVAGSGLDFIDRGAHELEGIEGSRQVLALAKGDKGHV